MTSQTTFFGLEAVRKKLVRRSDIEALPFYEFWQASALGSGELYDPDTGEYFVYLHDWENFSRLFIKTGKHRWAK